MTAKKKKPAKRGRKPLPEDQKMEQLTVRLSPKVKFGLELLARAQRKSLSSAVEWAVLRGLHSYEVSEHGDVLGDALDVLWPPRSEFETLELLRQHAPQTLSDDDRWLLEGILESHEVDSIQQREFELEAERRPATDRTPEQIAYREQAWGTMRRFVVAHWPQIREAIMTRSLQGKSLKDLSICELAGYPHAFQLGDPTPVFERLLGESDD